MSALVHLLPRDGTRHIFSARKGAAFAKMSFLEGLIELTTVISTTPALRPN